MSQAAELVALARRSGLRLEARPPDRLHVAGPADAVSTLTDALRSLKAAVLRVLAEERCGSQVPDAVPCPWPVSFACPACGTREVHGHA